MSAPDFDQLADLFVEEGAMTFSPSELHGTIVGYFAAGQRFESTGAEQFCASQLDLERISQSGNGSQLEKLSKQALEQLESNDFNLALLLPEDDHSLPVRAEHLGLWVSGFLAGFGLGATDRAANLSSEAQESLRDLVQISQIDADQEGEEEESLLVEVEEYVRMAAMLLFTECNRAGAEAPKMSPVH